MKLVYLKVTGYRNYRNSILEIDFRLNKRVRSDLIIDELDEIQENIYIGNSYPFIGPNSSGKTTTFNTLNSVLRVMFGEDKVESYFPTLSQNYNLHIDFYYIVTKDQANVIINNKTTLGKNEFGQICVFEEKIYERNLVKADRQSTLLDFKEKDLKYDSKVSPFANDTFLHNKRYLGQNKYFTHFHTTNEDKYDVSSNYFVTYFKNMINTDTIVVFENILKLFDSNIEYIKFADNPELFTLKLKRYDEQIITLENLSTLLSDGTRRGARLFYTVFLALRVGGVVIIDEIELHLHKALAIELVMLFQSRTLNQHQATLIFSTHYTEILDIFDRKDVIHVVKNEDGIENYKLSDIEKRNDILSSKVFLNHILDSSPSYEQKMEVRKLFGAK